MFVYRWKGDVDNQNRIILYTERHYGRIVADFHSIFGKSGSVIFRRETSRESEDSVREEK